LKFSGKAKAFIKNLNATKMENLIDAPGGMIILDDDRQLIETSESMPEFMKRDDEKSEDRETTECKDQ
jgi:hypothetical protein